MKSFLFLMLFPFLVSGNKPPAAPPDCDYKANFTTSDIDVVGNLECKVTSQVQIPIENKGTCVWKKNDVYIQVLFYTGPVGFNKSDGYNIFRTREKHLMSIDNIPGGRAAKFNIRFDPVELKGLYRLGFTLMHRNGQRICGPISKDLRFTE